MQAPINQSEHVSGEEFLQNVRDQIETLMVIDSVLKPSLEERKATMQGAFQILDTSLRNGEVSHQDYQAAIDIWLERYPLT